MSTKSVAPSVPLSQVLGIVSKSLGEISKGLVSLAWGGTPAGSKAGAVDGYFSPSQSEVTVTSPEKDQEFHRGGKEDFGLPDPVSDFESRRSIRVADGPAPIPYQPSDAGWQEDGPRQTQATNFSPSYEPKGSDSKPPSGPGHVYGRNEQSGTTAIHCVGHDANWEPVFSEVPLPVTSGGTIVSRSGYRDDYRRDAGPGFDGEPEFASVAGTEETQDTVMTDNHRPRSQNRRNSLAGQPGRDEWQNSMPASHQDDRFDERPYTDQSRADTHESRQRRGIMKATKRRRQQYSDNSDDSGARPSQVRGANVRFTDDESMGNSYVTDSYSGGCMPPGPSGQPLRDIPHEEITAAMHNLGMSSEGYHQPSVRDRQQPGQSRSSNRSTHYDDNRNSQGGW